MLFHLIHNIGNNKWISVVVVFLLFINGHKFIYVILESSPFVNLYTRTSNSWTKYLYFKYANTFLVVRSRNHKLSKTDLRQKLDNHKKFGVFCLFFSIISKFGWCTSFCDFLVAPFVTFNFHMLVTLKFCIIDIPS